MSSSNVNLMINPTEFFHEKLQLAVQQSSLSLDSQTAHYLVNILVEFIHTDRLASSSEDIDPLSTPLALILNSALEAPAHRKPSIFKTLGDTSLYMAGYFQDYFNRRTYGVSYVIDMGAIAYANLATLGPNAAFYDKLASDLPELVEIMAYVSDEMEGTPKSENILATYTRWLESQSERLRKKLERSGISPVPINPREQ